jgi:uncharacterized protein YccT (UPF0319 family)
LSDEKNVLNFKSKVFIVVFDARKTTFFLMPKCRTAEEHAAQRILYPTMPRWDELEHPINSILYRELREGMLKLKKIIKKQKLN